MKNLLILIVAAAVFLHFYPQPELEAWYEEKMTIVMDKFGEFTSTQVQLKPERVYLDIEAKFSTFRKSEQAHVKKITQTSDSIEGYYIRFCKNRSNRDQKLHRNNQEIVCRIIDSYSRYF